ncbi:hypothetical protein ACIOC1_00245 [Streptomyces sp. NPDC088197]|uniref:hypothetical protein n=1 Tax=Streptomyces sp. NPDC088197 TaxID=3365840 RepID=UPI0037FD21E7
MSNSTTTLPAPSADRQPVFTDDGQIRLGPFVDRYLCDADARAESTDLTKMAGLANATSLTAQARAAFPRVVVQEVELPGGTVVLYREASKGKPHYIAWDPAQTTRAKVEILITIYVAGSGAYVEYTPEVYRALRSLATFRKADHDPKVIAFWDEVEQQVIASTDPAAAIECISRTITREHAAILAEQAGGAA